MSYPATEGGASERPERHGRRGTFDTQAEAIARGRELAQNQKTELFIHGEDGRIREIRTYSPQGFPPKG